MDKLIDYMCDELEQLERKVDKGGKLSSQELQYLDTLAHAKKNLLTGDAMMSPGEYSNDYSMRNGHYSMAGRGYSNARGRGSNAKRDSMGRYSSNTYGYSRDDERAEIMDTLQSVSESTNDNKMKRMIQNWMNEAENM